MTGVAEGLRVLDFTWFAVGPVTTKYLADNGAEVIKIESRQRPDGLRLAPPFKGDPSVSLNRSQYFGNYNSSKKSVSIDMSTEQGRDLVRRLVPHCDILAESFRVGTMAKWGLGYEKLRELRPDLIYLATCLQGQTGPRAGYAGFGTQLAAISGFYNVSGYSPDELTPVHGPYTDFVAPRFSCFALLSAIDHRRRTGEGQLIDMSQYEAALNFLAPALTDYFATGRVAQADGNHSGRYAPHGAYRCRDDAGGERWIALSVAGDEQWRDLLRVLSDDAGRSMFPTHAGRLERPDEVDRYIGALVAGRDATELTAALQQAGIPAYPVQNCADLRADENLCSWGYVRELDQSECGPMPYDGFAYRLDRTPGVQTAAPNIGEHTDEVLSSLLGLSEAEIGRLRDAKILN
jgi:crotonobetainyl-CoA:carnitine CoA-transferase CaiB-like acyl-CoA transferase